MMNCQKQILNQIEYKISPINKILNMDIYCPYTNKIGSIAINTNNPSYFLGNLLHSICEDCPHQSFCRLL